MQEASHSAATWKFPILRGIGRLARRFLANWRQRHQLPFNFWIHLIGIPLAVAGLCLLFFEPGWGLALFFVGYLLQYVGHWAEGNDLGEWAALKRIFGLLIVPRWQTGVDAKPTPASLLPP